MESPLDTRTLARFLKSRYGGPRLGGLAKLKVTLRPYICPFEDLLRFIAPGTRVMDIGCGGGTFLALACEFRRPRHVAGIEIDRAALAVARSVLETAIARGVASVDHYDGITIPDSVREADTVFLIDVLHHVHPSKQTAFLGSIIARLAPNAVLVLKDIDAARPVLCWCNKLHDLVLAGETGHEVSQSTCAKLLVAAGAELIEQHERRMIWYPHYTIVARRR